MESELINNDDNKNNLFEEFYKKYILQIKTLFIIFIFIILISSFYIKRDSSLNLEKIKSPLSQPNIDKSKTDNPNIDKPNTDNPNIDNTNTDNSNSEQTTTQQNNQENTDIKLCLCVIAKLENKYIREFVEFYKKMKVDKIFIYDNNDLDGENFEDVISDYIESGYVNITNFRGLERAQHRSYQDCYRNNIDLFDWFIFYDVDEFIYLKDFDNIKSFLMDKRFNDCQRVQLNWVFYTDNNLLFYENKPVLERFTEKEPNARRYKTGGSQEIKSMVRGHIHDINIHCIHVIDKTLKVCDGFGNKKQVIDLRTLSSDYEYYYLRHFYSKSTEEFIEKIMKTDAVHAQSVTTQMNKISRYFTYSEVTNAKLNLIEKRTGLDLSRYRYRAKKI